MTTGYWLIIIILAGIDVRPLKESYDTEAKCSVKSDKLNKKASLENKYVCMYVPPRAK